MKIVSVPLASILVSPDVQPRCALHPRTVLDYLALIKEGVVLPRMACFGSDAKPILAAGFHRHAALKKFGAKSVEVDMHPGGLDDAKLFALADNHGHGLRLNRDDKHRSVMLLLKLKPQWTDRRCADHLHKSVSASFIASVRAKLAGEGAIPETDRREGRDGKTYPVNPPKAPDPPAPPPAAPASPPPVLFPAEAPSLDGTWRQFPLNEGFEATDRAWKVIEDLEIVTAGQLYDRIVKGGGLLPTMNAVETQEVLDDLAKLTGFDGRTFEQANPPKPAAGPPKANGVPAYDWQKFDAAYANLIKESDRLILALPIEKTSLEHRAFLRQMDDVGKTLEAWRDRLTRGKVGPR